MSEISLHHPSPLSISSVAAFPVRICPSQAKEPAWRVIDPACFSRWPGSFGSWCPASSSWRTCQRLLVGGWMSYSGPWPLSGTMRAGEVCEHQRWVRPTVESGGSASAGWPTAAKWDGHDSLLTLSKAGWLCRAVRWRRKKIRGTPNVQYPLTIAVRFNLLRADAMKRVDDLSRAEAVAPEHFYLDGEQQLNPDWVESLMGFPPGWTSLDAGPPPQDHSTTGSLRGSISHQAGDIKETSASQPSEIQLFQPALKSSATGSAPSWSPCRCGDWWCNTHQQHAHDCPCPAVEDQDGDPYCG